MKCQFCLKPTQNPVYCSRSCSAKANNRLYPKGTPTREYLACKNCGTLFPKSQIRTSHCSIACRNANRYAAFLVKIEADEIVSWRSLRKYLLEKSGKCAECGIGEWQSKPITLECDHKDGDITNNRFSNARLLCPNCHSQTPTFRYKNFGNKNGAEKRKARYLRNYKAMAPAAGIEPTFSAPATAACLEGKTG